MKHPLLLSSILCLALSFTLKAQIIECKDGSLRLVGTAPKETIVAESKTLKGKFDLEGKEFNFRQNLNNFAFSQGSLQKKDAEEVYWETHKYPNATLKGKIINEVDLTKDGSYDLTGVGTFSIHGVERELKFPVKLTMDKGKAAINCKFEIYLSDHDIRIPRLVALKVAEAFEVNVELEME